MIMFKEGKDPLSSLGQSVGQGIGGGLSQLLASHVAKKARAHEQNSLAEKLLPLVGGNKQHASAIAALGYHNPRAQQSAIETLMKQYSAGETYNRIKGQGAPTQQYQPTPQDQNKIQEEEQPQQPEQAMQQARPNLQTPLQARTGQQPSFTEQQMLQSLVPQQQQQAPRPQPKKQQQIQPQQLENQGGNVNPQQDKLERIREEVLRQNLPPSVLEAYEKSELAREKNQVDLEGNKLKIEQNKLKAEQNKIRLEQLALQQALDKEKYADSKEERQFGREQLGLKREQLEFDKTQIGKPKVNQGQIDASNSPYLKQLDVATNNARELKSDADELLKLLNTGKVAYGISGYRPNLLHTNESAKFDTIARTIAGKLASQKGLPTKFKIQYAESTKPSLTNKSRAVQRELIEKIINDSNRIMVRSDIKDQIITENEGIQPANIGTLVENRVKELTKHVSNDDDKKQLEGFLYPEGDEVELLGTGNRYIMKNGSWQEVK